MKIRTLSPDLHAALARRAVACAWLTLCGEQQRYPGLTLARLERAIETELEGFYLRQHGRLRGQEIACALLDDLLAAGPLKSSPGLSFLGQVVMDELSGRIHDAPPLH
ncbi:DUF5375 domain-containing protein [Pantoea anthophila]|uniref:DUF5375 domain-containing protein n=1 Tax=Pantoea anthophila TaxID=470931 RepID=UPI00254BDB59|nr:DUF5375 domain-containing protein [Pantoea anthophila]WIM56935.1 DUF5375 domain-containing protein [Pantoea anthophila]